MATKSRTTRSPKTASGERDYVAIALAYAQEAVSDKRGKYFGKWIRLAAKRYLGDLKRAKAKASVFVFDPWHANDACDFIEKMPHVEGVWTNPDGTEQKCILLDASHVFFVVQLFGFRTRSTGARRFTSALFAVARKNAKSTLAAAILLYCQCCEQEPGAQVISAATTGSQARIIFNVAKKMAEKTSALREAFGLECWANAISRVETGSTFKPINAKASTQDGLNPSHVGLDEIHAHKDADLLNVLQSAAGARRSPLFLFTTTEGYINAGPWGDLRRFAQQLLEGVFGYEADHFLALFYAVDDADADFDQAAWVKANPLLRANPHLLSAIRKEAVEAKAMPSKLAEFRIKRLNRQSAAANAWVDLTRWKKCDGMVDLAWLEGQPCWGGLDLASTRDLTAFRLVWLVDGIYYTFGWRWVPTDAVAQRTERGTVPYASWVSTGLIQQTEGDVTDYAVVEAGILAACERFRPQAIAYDAWNASDLVNRLVEAEMPMVQFIQGPKSYHPAMQALEVAYISGKFAHGGDPVLTWCAANVIPRYDQNMNAAPDKKRAPDKMDDMTALLMAIGVSQGTESETLSQAFVVL